MNEREPEVSLPRDLSEQKILADLARISTNSIGEPLTWGATPLVSTWEIKIQQDDVKAEINKLFSRKNTPEYVSPELAQYIEILNMSRTANRETHNLESFAYREKADLNDLPGEVLEVIDRAARGFASPAELLFIQDLLGVPTIELASLTHPYGRERIKLLKEMRPAVNNAITLMGGALVRGIKPTFKIKGAQDLRNPKKNGAIHMTRETPFGELPSGVKVMERSSFVVILDQLPSEQAEVIRSIPYENNKNWADSLGYRGGLYKLAPELLNNDDYEKAAPVSTTIVASNEALQAKLLSKEAVKEAHKNAREKQQQVLLGSVATKNVNL
ncbi:MAG: hypothetical protein JWN12_819 [Candidatus Saccharibacteria bacterium]|nr:hypothetical protein [Candidatus Saccharibacteria bacterium]